MTRMMQIDELCAALREAAAVRILTHVSPDGDALGSSLALKLGLEQLGKRATLLCQDEVPALYRFMPYWEQVMTPDRDDGPVPLAVAVDVADRLRLGNGAHAFDAAERTAVIDHHGTNPGYGQINYVDPEASASSVLIFKVLRTLGIALDDAMATCLYVGISTDTGHFAHRNLNAEAMRVAADCLETHMDPTDVSEKLYRIRSLPKTLLLTRALESLALAGSGRLVVLQVTALDFEQTGAKAEDTESIIDYGIAVEGSSAAILAVERPEGIKFSLRSRPPVDVGRICAALGGGGLSASGLLFDFDPDDGTYLAFALTTRGYVVLQRGAEGLELLVDEPLDTLRPDGRNRLELRANGSAVEVVVNGETAATLNGSQPFSGGVGLIALGGGVFEFQDFHYQRP
ncbi:MAG TPA: DHH family phosphoesterase [Clostridia bacterium]|nr:DHH family phosphoesterase [Clostridia bacterium]